MVLRSAAYSVYLLYWYESTNTDAAGYSGASIRHLGRTRKKKTLKQVALLILYSYFTHILLILRTLKRIVRQVALLLLFSFLLCSYFAHTLLILYWLTKRTLKRTVRQVDLLLLYSYFAHNLLMLYSCFTDTRESDSTTGRFAKDTPDTLVLYSYFTHALLILEKVTLRQVALPRTHRTHSWFTRTLLMLYWY